EWLVISPPCPLTTGLKSSRPSAESKGESTQNRPEIKHYFRFCAVALKTSDLWEKNAQTCRPASNPPREENSLANRIVFPVSIDTASRAMALIAAANLVKVS